NKRADRVQYGLALPVRGEQAIHHLRVQETRPANPGGSDGTGEQLAVEPRDLMLLPRGRMIAKRVGADQVEDLHAAVRQAAVPDAGPAACDHDHPLSFDARPLCQPLHEWNPVEKLEANFPAPRADDNGTIRSPEQRRAPRGGAMMARGGLALSRS